MEIGSATTAFAANASLTQTSAATVRQQADAKDSHAYQRAMGTTASDASNVLASNFASANAESSKYVKATISSLQTQNSFGDRMGSLLDGLSAQYSLLGSSMQTSSGNGAYVAATIMQHRVEEGVQRTTENEVADQSSNNLDDLKEDIEQRAQDATQPRDATSQTGQDGATDGVATTATSAAATNASTAETADAGEVPTASPDTPQGEALADAATEAASPTTGENAAPLSPSSPGASEDAAATALPMAAYATQQATRTPPATTTVDMRV